MSQHISSTTLHLTHDGLGSVRQVLDESLDSVATTDFAPYGEPLASGLDIDVGDSG